MKINNTDVLLNLKPRLFKTNSTINLSKTNFLSQKDVNGNISVDSTSSFRYDPLGSGIKSTQQFNVDWSDFAQHTFYNSAQVKTNEAFKTIINEFPFDGTKIQYEQFVDSLTGYQKYILDSMPTNFGYYFANGSGSISVLDVAGAAIPSISLDKRGNSILNPGTGSFSSEFWLWVPNQTNDNSIIFQKISGSNFGISCWLSASTTSNAVIGFTINSQSANLTVSQSVTKGIWNHCGFSFNGEDGINNISSYLNGAFISASNKVEIGQIDFDSANLNIFSGSTFIYTPTTQFVPKTYLSGAIDEFRFWHKTLSTQDILQNYLRNIFTDNSLKLYFRFNEPSDITKNIILDYSGNSLFGTYQSRSFTTSSIGASPLTYEQTWLNPILFSNNTELTALKTKLLISASNFDSENPSIITNLIPEHYFLEGQIQDGLSSEVGEIENSFSSEELPRTTQLGETQVLLSLLYAMATFFDEVQLSIKEFSNLIHIDYDQTNIISDYFLQFLAQRYGITLPDLFTGSTLDQFISGDNILANDSSAILTNLRYIQNQIWKRILINANDILNSKGTKHSIELFMRSVGVEPNSTFKIKEYGGPIQRSLLASREQRQDVTGFLNFSSASFVTSSYLSGSRVEPGFPAISGTASDGLFTSGSWTFEGLYRLNPASSYDTQSLARLSTKLITTNQETVLANLLAFNSGTLKLTVRPNTSFTTGQTLNLYLTGAFNLFDYSTWSISFGKHRNDQIIGNTSPSSSFFIRLAKQSYGEIIESYVTSAFYDDNIGSPSTNLFTALPASVYVPSGTFIAIGSASVNAALASQINPETNFDGKVSQIKFWSRHVKQDEWFEHVKNYKSIGTNDPLVTNQFEIVETGSFEKIRLDCAVKQYVTESNSSGEIILFDYSQNNLFMTGSRFPASTKVITPQIMYYSILSPSFDEAVTYSKVRVRSLQDVLNSDESYIQQAPVYELGSEEQPTDNTKLSIDFSITDSLNQDIVNIFGSFDSLNQILGDPNNLFASEYVGLENLRKAYFKRLTNNINLKSFFEMYKWFDESYGNFIKQLVGRNVKYKGINFVVQPHMLERSKVQYYFFNQYLNRLLSAENKDILTIQLLNGPISKF
ncbi:LamG domain-containing protein [bacterium]|nr:LamG domain-containing protein [bacterium]